MVFACALHALQIPLSVIGNIHAFDRMAYMDQHMDIRVYISSHEVGLSAQAGCLGHLRTFASMVLNNKINETDAFTSISRCWSTRVPVKGLKG